MSKTPKCFSALTLYKSLPTIASRYMKPIILVCTPPHVFVELFKINEKKNCGTYHKKNPTHQTNANCVLYCVVIGLRSCRNGVR